MADKIRFARFVLNEIAKDGMQSAEGFMGPDYYVDPRRTIGLIFRGEPSNPVDKDDWSLYIEGWIFKSVRLYRGKDWFKIDLTKEEKREFLQAEKNLLAKQKEAARVWKEAKEARRVAAQDWP